MTVNASRPTVVFLNRFYWPDHSATAQILTDLAEDLARDGWDVRVIASRRRYSASDMLPGREMHASVRIVRTLASPPVGPAMLRRVIDYALYVAGAALASLRMPAGSTFVGMTDPPLLGAVAVFAARARRGHSVYWTQDVFPDLAAKLGVIRESSTVFRMSARVARAIYRRADRVVAIGPAMAQALQARGAPADRTDVIHNWADADAITPVASESNSFIDEHGLRGKHVVLYSGNAGRAHTFGAVIASVRTLRGRTDVVFLFIGGGPQTRDLESAAQRDSLMNMRFLPYVPRERLHESLSAATISLVTENPAVCGLLVPSKAYGILASGRPIVYVGPDDSDIARLIRELQCGAIVAPNDAAALTSTIERLCDLPPEREAMGQRARRAAIERFDRRHAVRQWSELLSTLSVTRSVAGR